MRDVIERYQCPTCANIFIARNLKEMSATEKGCSCGEIYLVRIS